ncbi:MAG: transcription antitermination factor NusB [Thermoleophilia bacterium]|nr:transcription antitermination factor NusB [Thermoleophilia bacterium]
MARTPDPSEAEFVRRVREPRAPSAEPGRHLARRSAMMLLYRTDLISLDSEEAIAGYATDYGLEMPKYGVELVRGVVANQAAVDAEITERLDGWTLDRLGTVERAVMRIGMYELQHGEVPGPVVIDEAVELAKRYASPDAAKLVNGVLAARLRAVPDVEPDATEEARE